MFHDKIKSLFSSSVQDVLSRISDFAVYPEKDFTCRKKFPADILAGIRSLMGQKMYILGTGGTVLIITWRMS